MPLTHAERISVRMASETRRKIHQSSYPAWEVSAIPLGASEVDTSPCPATSTPYPWCIEPKRCSHLGYCPRNPSCGD
jgi:hypothetical protein